MKHCPNPACPGIEMFGAVSEFNDTASECSDCGGPLVDGPAPAPTSEVEPDPDMKLVAITAAGTEADTMIIESLLQDAGIRYLAQGEQIQDLFGIGRLTPVNPISGPVEFLVAEEDAEAAREILADFLGG